MSVSHIHTARYASVTFTIDPEAYGVDFEDDKAIIELLREKLELQPFSWELIPYSLDETIGHDATPTA